MTYSGEKITLGQSVPTTNTFTAELAASELVAHQDGAVYGDYSFLCDKYGTCSVYSVDSYEKITSFSLEKNDLICPHSNSVVFGSMKYDESDEFPLLYANVYNNYQNETDTKQGYCLVYRIQRSGTVFTSTLVQIIKIGFVENTEYWYAEGETRPYGNFVIDTDSNRLYAYVMRSDKTTFIAFDIPALTAGSIDDTYGVNVVALTVDDIKDSFNVEYFRFIQGTIYYDGKIYSLEGFGGSGNDGKLKVIDLESKSVVSEINFSNCGFDYEPEMIYIKDGKMYVSFLDTLTLYELNFI